MNTTHDDDGYPSSLLARLRHEARSTRPSFSDALHDRLMERIASERMSLPSRNADVLQGRPMRLSRFAMPIAATVAVAAVMTVLVTGRGPDEGPVRLVPIEFSNPSRPADMPSVGIDSLPLYDDIDAGVRAGAWMLASSLVDVPDWASLADFNGDAAPRDVEAP